MALFMALIMVLGSLYAAPVQVQAAGKKTIKLNYSEYTLKKGGKLKLKAKTSPGKYKVVWSSSRKKVASVSQKGVVRGLSRGSAKITAKIKGTGQKAVCKVSVGIPVKKITVKEKQIQMTAGDEIRAEYTVTPSNATNKSVTFTSSAKAVAGVSKKGVIKAKSEGSTVITIKAQDGSNKKAKITVTVVNKPEVVATTEAQNTTEVQSTTQEQKSSEEQSTTEVQATEESRITTEVLTSEETTTEETTTEEATIEETTTEAATTEKVMTQQPTTEAQPTTQARPTTEAQPTTQARPTTEAQPTTQARPTTEAQPTTQAQQPTTEDTWQQTEAPWGGTESTQESTTAPNPDNSKVTVITPRENATVAAEVKFADVEEAQADIDCLARLSTGKNGSVFPVKLNGKEYIATYDGRHVMIDGVLISESATAKEAGRKSVEVEMNFRADKVMALIAFTPASVESVTYGEITFKNITSKSFEIGDNEYLYVCDGRGMGILGDVSEELYTLASIATIEVKDNE